jgi:hypothetical protein
MTETYIPDEKDVDHQGAFLWKSEREHPIYIELWPPSLDSDGDHVCPAGIEDYRMVMGTNSLFSISYSNVPEYIEMMEEFRQGPAQMFVQLRNAIDVSLYQLKEVAEDWAVLYHPVDQLGVAELMETHTLKMNARQSFEEHLERFHHGDFKMVNDSGLVIFDLPSQGRKTLTLRRPPQVPPEAANHN